MPSPRELTRKYVEAKDEERVGILVGSDQKLPRFVELKVARCAPARMLDAHNA